MEPRARILSGAIAAVFAGFIAEFVAVTPFPNSPRFPSERAAMFAGLAIAVFLIRPKLGSLAIGCTLVVGVSHVCLGLHRPTDILGSFCLGAALVCLAQMQLGSALGRRLMRWEAASGSTFYMCAFFSSYLMSTAFQDLRPLTSKFLRL
jgi:membrane-associated phospholipid phosphatase